MTRCLQRISFEDIIVVVAVFVVFIVIVVVVVVVVVVIVVFVKCTVDTKFTWMS